MSWKLSDLFGRHRPAPRIAEGETWTRTCPDRAVETAHIQEIVADEAGIPHVRFRLTRRHSATLAEEQRTLSISCFTERYRDRITPPAPGAGD